MLYNAAGFALALGAGDEPISPPAWMHFGIALPHRDAVLALRDRLAVEGVDLTRGVGRARDRGRHLERGTPREATCRQCGREFTYPSATRPRVYCYVCRPATAGAPFRSGSRRS